MKKRILTALFAATMLLTLTACGKNTDENTPSPASEDPTTASQDTSITVVLTDPTEATTTTTESTTTTEATTTTTAPTVSNDPFVFTCDELHFSLTMPASWDGAFAHRHDGTVVSFYELSNHQYDGSGKLFTIRFMSPEIDVDFPESRVLGTYGDYNVILMYPSDVQFNFDDDAMTQKYLQMQSEVEGIISTFTYLG